MDGGEIFGIGCCLFIKVMFGGVLGLFGLFFVVVLCDLGFLFGDCFFYIMWKEGIWLVSDFELVLIKVFDVIIGLVFYVMFEGIDKVEDVFE